MVECQRISVTPFLSHLTEKILVRNWLLLALGATDLSHQFTFKATGSAACTLISCIDNVAKMLESNNYVRHMLIDNFSKAFDTVDHAIVLRKMNALDLPLLSRTG